MKVSEWLRIYQLAGQPPDKNEPLEMAFWCGWLIGHQSIMKISSAERVEMAIKCAEFIERI